MLVVVLKRGFLEPCNPDSYSFRGRWESSRAFSPMVFEGLGALVWRCLECRAFLRCGSLWSCECITGFGLSATSSPQCDIGSQLGRRPELHGLKPHRPRQLAVYRAPSFVLTIYCLRQASSKKVGFLAYRRGDYVPDQLCFVSSSVAHLSEGSQDVAGGVAYYHCSRFFE